MGLKIRFLRSSVPTLIGPQDTGEAANMKRGVSSLLFVEIAAYAGLMTCLGTAGVCQESPPPQTGKEPTGVPKTKARQSRAANKDTTVTPNYGTPHLWEDRGTLTPAQVFWGAASRDAHPEAHLPTPPFTNFEPDDAGSSPKCKVTDANGEKWTVKFGEEVHPDVAAPRLAWALGYEVEESYYLKAGKIEGVTTATDRDAASLTSA